jgi:uncharacterized protein
MILQKHLTENAFKAPFIVGIILTVTLKLILYSVASLSIPDYLPWGYVSRGLLWFWLLLIWLYIHYIERKPFFLLKEEKHPAWFYFSAVTVLMVTFFAVNYIPALFSRMQMSLADTHVQAEMMAYQHERPFLLLITAVTAGIVEESIFRGYMLPRLHSLLNKQWAAVLIGAVLYAALHYTYGSWLNMLIPFLIGIVFGFFYLKYRSLTILVIAHIITLLILGVSLV